ncbi:hypothetical protein, partial [Enterococcus faecium]|uniref:hypothetical protein n=2 Tax=Bacteria TaxID=2 RepID=UPI003F43CA3E
MLIAASLMAALAPARAQAALGNAAAAAPLGGDWRDWPVTPGTWVYRQDARGSIALFGVPGNDAEVTLRCDRAARALYLSRRGMAAG